MTFAHFSPWARAERQAPDVPVNTRLTRRQDIICVRQEEIDAARLRELTLQLEDLEFERANAAEGESHLAACAALDVWNTDHRDEIKRLTG